MPEVIRVLYVEEGLDEKTSSRVLEQSVKALKDYVFIFTVVSNPFIGLEQTQFTSFDMIICQECPYGLDVYEFARVLRNLGDFTPIVALTLDEEMKEWADEVQTRVPMQTIPGERAERIVSSMQVAENSVNLNVDVAERQSSFSRLANTYALRKKIFTDDGFMSILKKPYSGNDLQNVVLEAIALRNEKDMPGGPDASADLVRREVLVRLRAEMDKGVSEKVKEVAPYILEREEGGDTSVKLACNKELIEVPHELEARFTEAQKLSFEKLPFQSARFHHESAIKSRQNYEEKMNYAMLKKVNPRGKNKKRGAELMTQLKAKDYDANFYNLKSYGAWSPPTSSQPEYRQGYQGRSSSSSAPTVPMSPQATRVQADFSDLADPSNGEPGGLGDLLSAVRRESGYTGPLSPGINGASSPDAQSQSSHRSLGSVTSLGDQSMLSRQDSVSSAPGAAELDVMVKEVLGRELDIYAANNAQLKALMESDVTKFKATANTDPEFRDKLAKAIEDEVSKYREKKRNKQVLEGLLSMQDGRWKR